MNSISLYYFLEASKDLNFSQTARRLYISQQKLSNHIANLEKYYNVQLFERKPRLNLTCFGEILVEYAIKQRIEEDSLRKCFEDNKRQEIGSLQIGCSPNRTSLLISTLVSQFLERYPNVQVNLHHHHSSVLAEKVLSGELDFSISVPQMYHSSLITSKLFKDYIFLMVKDSLFRKYYGDNSDDLIQKFKNGVAIRDFKKLPLLTFRESKLVDSCFLAEGESPKLFITSNYPQFFMMDHYENFVATIISKGNYIFMRDYLKPDIHVFPILVKGEFKFHDIAFIRHKKKYFSSCVQYFFSLAKDYFKKLDSMVLIN